MKTRFILLFFAVLGLAHTGLGQNVRWRFTIPAPTYQKDITQATLVANDGTGGAVFQITDYREYPPEAGISGLETAGSYLIWLSRTGTLLYTMTIENLEGSSPYPTLLTPTVLQIHIVNSAGKVIRLHRAVKKGQGVTVTNFTPPADETLAPDYPSISTLDQFGFFTFKKIGENTTEIVRYSL
jgi:hypothetical protein